jgi:RNase P subunit RPR2
MKIIKEGKIPSYLYRGTCGYCRSILQYNKTETLDFSEDQRDGLAHKINCPICNNDRWVYNVTEV